MSDTAATATTPFAIRNLSVLQYANGFTLWHYKAPAIKDVLEPDYFAEAAKMLAAGDHMHVSTPNCGALLFVKHVSDAAGRVWVRTMAASS